MPGAYCEKRMSWQNSNLGGVHWSLCRGPMAGTAFGCSVSLAHVGGAGLLYLPWSSDLSAACSACALICW